MPRTLRHYDEAEISQLLLGRKVTKVADDTAVLDNGVTLRFKGNEGGCSCRAGDYDLTELNTVDNVITKVEFASPDEDEWGGVGGTYSVFVYADNQQINLASFDGHDENGYYGTGYTIEILETLDTDHRNKSDR